MLLKRVLTAIVAIPIVFLVFLNLPYFYFSLLILAILLITIYESITVFLSLEGYYEKTVFPLTVLLVAFSVHYEASFLFVSLGAFALFLVFLMRNTMLDIPGHTKGRKTLQRNFQNLVNVLFFSLYLGVPFALCVRIRALPDGAKWMLVLLCVSWGSDTGAYFAGKYLKKYFPYRLFPIVSPNKTWVGSVIAVPSSILFAFIGDYILGLNAPAHHLFAISIIGNVFSQLGDLFESFIKRVHKIKDSGNLIPGHGGILDRIDGFIFAIPFLFWYLSRVMYG